MLAISNSGEKEEPTRIMPVLRRLGVPVVVMTGGLHSTLARHADIVIDSKRREGSLPSTAPTASTTVQFALGDAALAVALPMHADSGPKTRRRTRKWRLG